jgi:hypothetical protein
LGFNVPVLHGLAQLCLPAFSFVEKTNSGIQTVWGRPTQQLTEWSQRSGGNDVGCSGRSSFDAAGDDLRLLFQTHAATGLTEESTFPGVGFDQRHTEVGSHRGNHQTGKPTTTAKVGQCFGLSWYQGHQLG